MKATSAWTPDVAIDSLLEAQRSALDSAFGGDKFAPSVGDVWLSNATWQVDTDEDLTAMLVILRSFNETWSAKPLFDVAPVSDDQRLASEWSLILDAPVSGVGIPLIVHVDVQTTTTSSMLNRRVGRLAELACRDLQMIMRAYALGEIAVVELCIGRTGSINIRFHPEWDAFARQLVRVAQEFSAPVARERMAIEDANVEPIDVDEHSALAVACSDPVEDNTSAQRTWEYRFGPPFLYSPDVVRDNAHLRLGDAVATYYCRQMPPGAAFAGARVLDIDSFSRLQPFLNTRLSYLLTAPDNVVLRYRLLESVDQALKAELRSKEFATVVESIRLMRCEIAKRNAIVPTHMAARRSQIE
jgi:hypothetical protein